MACIFGSFWGVTVILLSFCNQMFFIPWRTSLKDWNKVLFWNALSFEYILQFVAGRSVMIHLYCYFKPTQTWTGRNFSQEASINVVWWCSQINKHARRTVGYEGRFTNHIWLGFEFDSTTITIELNRAKMNVIQKILNLFWRHLIRWLSI